MTSSKGSRANENHGPVPIVESYSRQTAFTTNYNLLPSSASMYCDFFIVLTEYSFTTHCNSVTCLGAENILLGAFSACSILINHFNISIDYWNTNVWCWRKWVMLLTAQFILLECMKPEKTLHGQKSFFKKAAHKKLITGPRVQEPIL